MILLLALYITTDGPNIGRYLLAFLPAARHEQAARVTSRIFVRLGGCNLHCDYCDEPDTIPVPSGKVWSRAKLEARIRGYELAYRMQAEAPTVVDLSKESDATKQLYGMDHEETAVFGRNCLLAMRRRL